MAYITIEIGDHGGLRTLHERLSADDLDNALFCDRLVERLRWAVEDTEAPDDLLAPAPPPTATLAAGVITALTLRAHGGE